MWIDIFSYRYSIYRYGKVQLEKRLDFSLKQLYNQYGFDWILYVKSAQSLKPIIDGRRFFSGLSDGFTKHLFQTIFNGDVIYELLSLKTLSRL